MPAQPQPSLSRPLSSSEPATSTTSADSLAELLERASGYYHPRFDELIQRLNRVPTATSQGECVRLCVEAVNLVLETQSQLAGELRRLDRRTRPATPARIAELRLRRSA